MRGVLRNNAQGIDLPSVQAANGSRRVLVVQPRQDRGSDDSVAIRDLMGVSGQPLERHVGMPESRVACG